MFIFHVYPVFTIVTRSKKKIKDKFGIRGCFVRLNVSLQAEVLNWLAKTDPKNSKNQEKGNHSPRDDSETSEPSKPRRRNTLVGASLFSVNNNVEKHSSDYLQKIQRPCALRMAPTEPTEPTEPADKLLKDELK